MATELFLRAIPEAPREQERDDGPVSNTVLIVDDHAGFRAAARSMLELAGWKVVGEAGDGATAVFQAKRLSPSLVLLDVGLPDVDGYEVAAQLAAAACPSDIVLVSARPARRRPHHSARGFLSKVDLSAEALRAVLGVEH